MAAIGNRRCNAASLGLMWMLADLTAPSLVQAQFFDIGSVVVPPLEARSSGERSSFARDRDVAVRDRIFPEFSAKGVPIGGLDLFPGLTIAGLATSNVFANNADRHGDLAAVIKPEATLRTRGGPVDLSIYGKAAITRFRRFHSENTEEESGGITADADVGHLSRLFGGASIGRLVLPRYASDSPFDAAKPLEYTEARAFAGGVYEPGKTRITVRVDEVRLRFHDAPRRGGGVILTKDRDRDVMSGSVRVERAIKPNMSVYLMGSGDWINYRLAPPSVPIQRDSKGWGAYVGSSFELTNLMRADVRVGYIHQKFNMPGVRPISGLGVKGKLQYFPSRLTTVTVQGERSVQDSGVPGTAGYMHSGGQLEIDHELRRYIVATLLAGRFRDNYKGQPRIENNSYAGVSGTYLSRNHWNAKLSYQYNRKKCLCSSDNVSFDDHRILANITFQY